nr:hypothetical protein [Tanacetum cinerariifolium]
AQGTTVTESAATGAGVAPHHRGRLVGASHAQGLRCALQRSCSRADANADAVADPVRRLRRLAARATGRGRG